MKIKPKLIVGLGNPGKEYEKTYHNVGFLAIDSFAKTTLNAKTKLFEYSKIDDLIFVKNRTFMNDAGKTVSAAMKYFSARGGLKPEELLVIHDDADLLLGKYKLSLNQGSAGHKGIESIIKALGTKNFYRLRIGIRNPKSKAKALNLVLKKIKNSELLILNQVFKEITENNLFI